MNRTESPHPPFGHPLSHRMGEGRGEGRFMESNRISALRTPKSGRGRGGRGLGPTQPPAQFEALGIERVEPRHCRTNRLARLVCAEPWRDGRRAASLIEVAPQRIGVGDRQRLGLGRQARASCRSCSSRNARMRGWTGGSIQPRPFAAARPGAQPPGRERAGSRLAPTASLRSRAGRWRERAPAGLSRPKSLGGECPPLLDIEHARKWRRKPAKNAVCQLR
jgi:hypothetical protein